MFRFSTYVYDAASETAEMSDATGYHDTWEEAQEHADNLARRFGKVIAIDDWGGDENNEGGITEVYPPKSDVLEDVLSVIAQALEDAGYTTEMMQSERVKRLTRVRSVKVVLPNGVTYPVVVSETNARSAWD